LGENKKSAVFNRYVYKQHISKSLINRLLAAGILVHFITLSMNVFICCNVAHTHTPGYFVFSLL